MSPAMLPSSFSGCGMKGIALLFAIMLILLLPAGDVERSGVGAINAETLATSAAKEATVAFMLLRWSGGCGERAGRRWSSTG